jgi:ribosomal protein S18 acetylase RimI-like enzyme
MDHDLTIRDAHAAADIEAARRLFSEYAASLGFSLCFQGFDEELASLPGKYAPPKGALLLAGGSGVVAVRPISAKIAEMKRLYVVPSARGSGLGQRLAQAAIAAARDAGYEAIRLDTIEATMRPAMALYRRLGFIEIPAYYDNPIVGARYFELKLP